MDNIQTQRVNAAAGLQCHCGPHAPQTRAPSTRFSASAQCCGRRNDTSDFADLDPPFVTRLIPDEGEVAVRLLKLHDFTGAQLEYRLAHRHG